MDQHHLPDPEGLVDSQNLEKSKVLHIFSNDSEQQKFWLMLCNRTCNAHPPRVGFGGARSIVGSKRAATDS